MADQDQLLEKKMIAMLIDGDNAHQTREDKQANGNAVVVVKFG